MRWGFGFPPLTSNHFISQKYSGSEHNRPNAIISKNIQKIYPGVPEAERTAAAGMLVAEVAAGTAQADRHHRHRSSPRSWRDQQRDPLRCQQQHLLRERIIQTLMLNYGTVHLLLRPFAWTCSAAGAEPWPEPGPRAARPSECAEMAEEGAEHEPGGQLGEERRSVHGEAWLRGSGISLGLKTRNACTPSDK